MSLSKSDRHKVALLASFFCATSLAALPKIGATDSPSVSTLTSPIAPSTSLETTSAPIATRSTKGAVLYFAQSGILWLSPISLGLRFVMLILLAGATTIGVYRLFFRKSIYEPWMLIVRSKKPEVVMQPN